MSATTNYNITKPSVGGSDGAWGTLLNNALDLIDSIIKSVSDVASAALPRTGGAMAGRLDAKTSTMQRVDKGSVSGAVSLDLSQAQAFTLTCGGAITLSFANAPSVASSVQGVLLRITNGGAAGVTWPTGTKWPGGIAPTLTASGVDEIVMLSLDGGSTWDSNVYGQAFA